MKKSRFKSLAEGENRQLSELSVEEVFEARLALENIDECDENNEGEGDESAGTSRKHRMKQLFSEALERVHGNDEDNMDTSVETSVDDRADNSGANKEQAK